MKSLFVRPIPPPPDPQDCIARPGWAREQFMEAARAHIYNGRVLALLQTCSVGAMFLLSNTMDNEFGAGALWMLGCMSMINVGRVLGAERKMSRFLRHLEDHPDDWQTARPPWARPR